MEDIQLGVIYVTSSRTLRQTIAVLVQYVPRVVHVLECMGLLSSFLNDVV